MLNDRFGTDDDLKSLSRQLHNRGMSVILSRCLHTPHSRVKVPHGRRHRQRCHGYLDHPRSLHLHVQERGQIHSYSTPIRTYLHTPNSPNTIPTVS